MELFRSERVSLARVIVPEEAARDTIERLGELACAQFQDLNPDVPLFKRAYAAHVRRAEELLRRLRYFDEEAKRAETPVARARTFGDFTPRASPARVARSNTVPVGLADFKDKANSSRSRMCIIS